MTYEEAKQTQKELHDKNKSYSAQLKTFDKYRNPLGLLPDAIRESNEYQKAKKASDISFSDLRNFNGWYVKTFKKELAAERRNKYKNH